MLTPRVALLSLLSILSTACLSQATHDQTADVNNIPTGFVASISKKASGLNASLTSRSQQYLDRMGRYEAKMQRRLRKADSAGATNLFSGVQMQYATLSKSIPNDSLTGTAKGQSGSYQPYVDSLENMLAFLRKNSAGHSALLATSLGELHSLETKMNQADLIRAFIRDRKQQIAAYMQRHKEFSGLMAKEYKGLNEGLYYYSQQVQTYRNMLNDPDKLMKQALRILNKMPAFQAFMKENSQLAGLFSLPGNYADPSTLQGLQTRDMVSALIQKQVVAAGAGGAAALTANIQAGQSKLQDYKNRLSGLGAGGGDIDMPNFKPNGQKTKTFWRRLEFGANFQTTRNNSYFPTISDLGLSVGYKLSDRNTIGIGASYKLGWGNGIQHIHFSSQGAGLRSFIDMKIKGSFFASGGFEYNYATSFPNVQQLRNWSDWTRSGLIGITKTISVKSRVFKKTKAQLLWDFLSYQQLPRTQPIIFRIGYNF